MVEIPLFITVLAFVDAEGLAFSVRELSCGSEFSEIRSTEVSQTI